ncbi:MAG: OmpA family protein [Microscillaceae bacterium]|nr:OmpA family protein [Microscillaceae bacterium]
MLTEGPVIIRENESFTPQIVNRGGYLLETEAWLEIADTLVAQGGEQYLTLGNFDSFRQKRLKKLAPQPAWRKKFNYYRAYYYLDLVKVEELGPVPLPFPPLLPRIGTDFGEIVPGEAIILQNVHFEFDKDELLPESFPELQNLARLLHQQPDWQVSILGHTDSIGTEAKNLDLSQRRAAAVVAYLQAQGIGSARLHALGQGESQPLRPNDTPENRLINRRVEFVILPPEK